MTALMSGGPQKVRRAVFPVGGLGTRFLPATKAVPKEMLPVVDKPVIQYAVEEAQAAGIEEFIFVTGRGKSAIEDHFDLSLEMRDKLISRGKQAEVALLQNWVPGAGQVAYTRQQEPLGLGHAVWCARHLIGDEPFAVVLADDLVLASTPCLRQLIQAHEHTGGNLVAVETVPNSQASLYGILDVEEEKSSLVSVRGLVEKPSPAAAPSNLAIIGRYILVPQIMQTLSAAKHGQGGEIQLTDALSAMLGRFPFHGLRFEGRRFDCGQKAGFIQANVAFALQRSELKIDFAAYLKEVLADTLSEDSS